MNRQNFYPLVSIVIPVYNGANYLVEAIESALSQTYKNIEIIVINDGSNDDGQTELIAKSYGSRIRYFYKINGGCASALNVGIANMNGEYFSWLSHDDKYLPNKIERQINVLASLVDSSTIVYGGYEVIDSTSNLKYTVKPDSVLNKERLNTPLLPLLRGLIHGCTLLIPKKYFLDIGVFNEKLLSTQDYALWFDFFRVAPLYFDDQVLVQSRVHAEQGTHKIARHNEECEELWSGFLKRLSAAEMVTMEGSEYKFLQMTERFLRNTPYKKTQQLAQQMSEECLDKTKISVVIPFFNRVGWTIEAIQSVQAQSHRAFEIILIDDGSTEDLTPIRIVCKNDSRIKYVYQQNAGPAAARNLGVQLSSGKYVAFLDADDLFVQDKLKTQLREMEENDWVLCHTSYQRMDLEGNAIRTVSSGLLKGKVFPGIIASCPIAMPTVMGKTEIFKNNPFPVSLEIGEDVCLWISLCSKYHLGGLDLVLSKVRVGPDTAALNKQKQAIGLVNIVNFVIHDKYLSKFERQVKSLLIDASALFSEVNGPSDTFSNQVRVNSHPSDLSKVLRSLRRDGFGATLMRIRSRLG